MRDWRTRVRHLESFERAGDARGHAALSSTVASVHAELAAARDQLQLTHRALQMLFRSAGTAGVPLFMSPLELPPRAATFVLRIPQAAFRTRAFRLLNAACDVKTPLAVQTARRQGRFLVCKLPSRANTVAVQFQQCG